MNYRGLTECSKVTYSDFYDFFYCVRDLKEHGFKVDFKHNYGFKILRRSDDKEVSTAYSVNALKSFVDALKQLSNV